jgi:hypothetical protein
MIAVLLYGEFRTYMINLEENLKQLFNDVHCEIHFYILTENCDNFYKHKQQVSDIINKFGYKINYFEQLKDCTCYDSDLENNLYADFVSIVFPGQRDLFTPKLLYRRTVINKVLNEYADSHNLQYTRVMFVRLFDTVIYKNKSLHFLNTQDDILYYGTDFIFIGNMNIINNLFTVDYISNILKFDNIYNFKNFFESHEYFLSTLMPIPMLALETIYIAIVYNNFLHNSLSIRMDFTRLCTQGITAHNFPPPITRDRVIQHLSQHMSNEFLLTIHCHLRKEPEYRN